MLDRQALVTTVLVVTASAAIGNLIATRYDEVAAALVFMLGVTVAGALGGLASALLAAAAAFLIFNFFVTEPALTFRLATGRDLAPLVIFNLCAAVTGILAGRLRDRSEAVRASNAQLQSLLLLSRALQSAARSTDVLATLREVAGPLLRARVALYRYREGELESLAEPGEDDDLRPIAITLLEERQQPTRGSGARALRLDGSAGPVGVLVLDGTGARALDPAFMTAFSGMVALALERAMLSEQVAERRAAARAEELKSAILSSVSHDFRTPLTAISASASSLLAYRDKLEPEVAQGFLRRIVDDCDRLNRYTANLLELSKLETGSGQGLLQTLDAADMLSVAVQRLRPRAGRRKVSLVTGDRELPVVANPALFELVLINVLENAILYSPDGTSISVAATRTGDCCRISVADEGCGIPEADLERVFERFVRVRRSESSPQGSGLGLAIARGFVEALGGSIAARTPGLHGRGTEIVISLPLAQERLVA